MSNAIPDSENFKSIHAFRKNYSERKVCTTCGKMVHYQHWALHQRSHQRAEGADELYHYCDQG